MLSYHAFHTVRFKCFRDEVDDLFLEFGRIDLSDLKESGARHGHKLRNFKASKTFR